MIFNLLRVEMGITSQTKYRTLSGTVTTSVFSMTLASLWASRKHRTYLWFLNRRSFLISWNTPRDWRRNIPFAVYTLSLHSYTQNMTSACARSQRHTGANATTALSTLFGPYDIPLQCPVISTVRYDFYAVTKNYDRTVMPRLVRW